MYLVLTNFDWHFENFYEPWRFCCLIMKIVLQNLHHGIIGILGCNFLKSLMIKIIILLCRKLGCVLAWEWSIIASCWMLSDAFVQSGTGYGEYGWRASLIVIGKWRNVAGRKLSGLWISIPSSASWHFFLSLFKLRPSTAKYNLETAEYFLSLILKCFPPLSCLITNKTSEWLEN